MGVLRDRVVARPSSRMNQRRSYCTAQSRASAYAEVNLTHDDLIPTRRRERSHPGKCLCTEQVRANTVAGSRVQSPTTSTPRGGHPETSDVLATQDDMKWTTNEVHGMCEPVSEELRQAITQQDCYDGNTWEELDADAVKKRGAFKVGQIPKDGSVRVRGQEAGDGGCRGEYCQGQMGGSE